MKVVVPFKAGGTSDQVARAFQMAIQENELMPQPMTIINVGGHFSVGSRQVMEAEPDGYNFLLVHIALMGGEGGGMFDFGWRDYEPVAATGQFCVLPMVRKDSGIDSVDQLLEKAAAEPDTLIFGANLGAINHMAGIMLQNTEPGAKFRFVQIGGGTANFTALTGAQTNATVLSGAEVLNFTKLPDGSDNPGSADQGARLYTVLPSGMEKAARSADHERTRPRHGVLHRQLVVRAQGHARRSRSTAWPSALEAATGTDQITEFYDSKAFAPVFLKGDELQQSLDRYVVTHRTRRQASRPKISAVRRAPR